MRPAVVITGISGNLGRRARASAAPQVRARHRHRPPPVPGQAQGHRGPPARHPQEEDRGRLPARRACAALDPHGDHARPAHELAGEHHTFNVLGTRNVLDYCAKYGVKKVVVLSSANVYGPSRTTPTSSPRTRRSWRASASPTCATSSRSTCTRSSFIWRHPEVETVILRPVHIVGPTIKNAPSNYLRLPRPWTLAGFDPMVQLIHDEDVCARAAQLALKPGVRGVYNVVGPGEVPLSSMLQRAGAHGRSRCRTRSRGRCSTASSSYTAHRVPAGRARPPPVPLHRRRLARGERAGLDGRQFTLRETIRAVNPE